LAERVPARLNPGEDRKFGLLVGGAFVGLAVLLEWRGRTSAAPVVAGIGVLLVAGGLLLPARLAPVRRAWMGLAHAISTVTTPVFMGVVYFVVFAPAGALMRLFGRNPIAPNHEGTRWVARETGTKSDMARQF
jgi:saxitoxin biosynthesis operon SxtJ-like protein